MNYSDNYHFEIQEAKATNGQKNGSVEESNRGEKPAIGQFLRGSLP